MLGFVGILLKLTKVNFKFNFLREYIIREAGQASYQRDQNLILIPEKEGQNHFEYFTNSEDNDGNPEFVN